MTTATKTTSSSSPLLPVIDDVSRPFFEGARRGELRVQRCVDTGRLLFPPRLHSPFGGRRPPEWIRVSGRGTIWSFVVPHPPLLPPFDAMRRYNVVLVALDEDPHLRLVGNLVARVGGPLDEVDADSIAIGEAVRAVFEPVTDEIHLLRFVRV